MGTSVTPTGTFVLFKIDTQQDTVLYTETQRINGQSTPILLILEKTEENHLLLFLNQTVDREQKNTSNCHRLVPTLLKHYLLPRRSLLVFRTYITPVRP